MNGITEVECVKCGVYIIVEVDDDRVSLVRGCSHYVVDSDLDYVRDEIMEEIR